jgi:hypothetical protein
MKIIAPVLGFLTGCASNGPHRKINALAASFLQHVKYSRDIVVSRQLLARNKYMKKMAERRHLSV